MLRSVQQTIGYHVDATDGTFGHVRDYYFDQDSWAVQYIVVDTGGWLRDKRVLVRPDAFGEPDWSSHTMPVALTRDQIRNAPDVAMRETAGQQQHYQSESSPDSAVVLAPAAIPAIGMMPPRTAARVEAPPGEPVGQRPVTSSLRSVVEVIGYDISASDGDIGHAEDFIAQTETWQLRYVVVDTRNVLPGKKVLLAPDWIDSISWYERAIHVPRTRETIRNCPEFDPSQTVNRVYEARLYDYYGVPRYWESGQPSHR